MPSGRPRAKMTEKPPRTTILVAVYNEAPTLPRVIRNLEKLRPSCPVIAVDDGSTDGSGRILALHSGPNFRVLRHPRNMGKGAAIRTALGAARTGFVLIHDADLETDSKDIPRLLGAASRHPGHAIFGTRFPRGRVRGRVPLLTRMVNILLTRVTNILFGSRLTDMACAFKLVPAAVLRRPPLKARRFDIDAEITARLLLHGTPVTEIPVRYHPRSYRQGKKIHPLDGLRILATLARLRLKSPPLK